MTVVFDILIAAVAWLLDLAFFSTAGSNLAQVGAGDPAPLWLAAYAALGAGALVWRRRAPDVVFWAVWAHAVAGAAFVHGYHPVVPVLVALYTIGAHRPRRMAWLIAPTVAPFAVIAANEAVRAGAPADRSVTFVGLTAFFALLGAGVWALGHWAGLSRRRLAESVLEERARISRELHDIVAHTVTVMVLQAAGAQKVMHTDPARAGEALGRVEALGRQAMSELRRMLALQGDAGDAADTVPQPGLDQLDELIERVRALGVPIEKGVEGVSKSIDPSVGLAAYRVVQESLTNAAKHAGAGARVRVRLVWGDDDLTLEVSDSGVDGAPPTVGKALSTGNGLLGLRERVAVAGGTMAAGRVASGGYAVRVSLPVGQP